VVKEDDATRRGREKKRVILFLNFKSTQIWHALKRDVLECIPSSILDHSRYTPILNSDVPVVVIEVLCSDSTPHSTDGYRSSARYGQMHLEAFVEIAHQKLVNYDNMQILHECKDSRDDHFMNRRNRNRNRTNQIPGSSATSRSTNDDFVTDDTSENLIFYNMLKMKAFIHRIIQ